MFKTTLKNILITFVISYTIINIIIVEYSRFEYYKMYKDEIKPMLIQREGEISNTEITNINEKELTYITGLVQGKMREVERNEKIILLSFLIGLCGGTTLSLLKNKKSNKANDKK